jgi:hypothetical protein
MQQHDRDRCGACRLPMQPTLYHNLLEHTDCLGNRIDADGQRVLSVQLFSCQLKHLVSKSDNRQRLVLLFLMTLLDDCNLEALEAKAAKELAQEVIIRFVVIHYVQRACALGIYFSLID